jgi:hypothetical protein
LTFEASAQQCSTQDCAYSGPLEPVQGPPVVGDIRVLAMNVYGQKEELGDGYCEDCLKTIGEFIADEIYAIV